MNSFWKIIFFCWIAMGMDTAIWAQVPTVGDCLGAIPVCEEVYEESTSPVGPGNYQNEINPGNCVQTEMNSVWYIFTVQNTGDFGFLLTPNELSDDYDWALFNLTGKTCEDIFSDPSMTVSCNAAGGASCNGITGADGTTPYSIQNLGCGQNPPVQNGWMPLNALVPVQAGNTYALLILNWTGSINGYTLDFSQSAEVGIFDNTPPSVVATNLPEECGDNTIQLQFSENVECSSFTGDAITITGPGGPYSVTVQSNNCSAGGDFSSLFNLTVNPSFQISGDYTISIDNSPNDLCDNPLINNQFDFTLDRIDEGTVSSLDSVFCGEFSYIIDADGGPFASYLWEDNTTDQTLSIVNSGLYSVTVEGACYTRIQEYNILFQGFPEIVSVATEPDACEGNFGEIEVTEVTGSDPFTYSLDDINYQDSPTFTNLATGDYSVFVHDEHGCEDEISVMVGETFPNFSVNLDQEITIELDETVQLNAEILGDYTNAYWLTDSTTLSCIDCLDPIASPLFTTVYTIQAIDEIGCIVQKSIIVNVLIPRDVFFPNTFSPNGDNVNDRFFIASGNQLANVDQLRIYSRWGELVFEGNDMPPGDPASGWDGKFKGRPLYPSVFTYIAKLSYIDGQKSTVRGTITIVK